MNCPIQALIISFFMFIALFGIMKKGNAQDKEQELLTAVSEKIAQLKLDPFDWVKAYVNIADPIELTHYNQLIEIELKQKESHILGLKIALLALHCDTTVSVQDKKVLALLLFETSIPIPVAVPNSEFYLNKYLSRLETESKLEDNFGHFSGMQGDFMAHVSDLKLNKTLEELNKSKEELNKSKEELNKSKEELNKSKELNKQLKEIYEIFNEANKEKK